MKVTGVTVHLVDETLDTARFGSQEAVAVLPGDYRVSLAAWIHGAEHRLLPRAVALIAAGAVRVEGGHAHLTPRSRRPSRTRRALVSVSDKWGLAELGRGLAEQAFEPTPRWIGAGAAIRGLDVTDVAAVTGFPEMLGGRVMTLHPWTRRRCTGGPAPGGTPRAAGPRAPSRSSVVVGNLIRSPRLCDATVIPCSDELIEEIDIGGPALVRAAAKNHESVAIVTVPADYPGVLDALAEHLPVPGPSGATWPSARSPTPPPTTRRSPRRSRALVATRRTVRSEHEPFPGRLDLRLERDTVLRYGENPHQRAALYTWLDADRGAGPFAAGAKRLQGKGSRSTTSWTHRRRRPSRGTCAAARPSSSSTRTRAAPPRLATC